MPGNFITEERDNLGDGGEVLQKKAENNMAYVNKEEVLRKLATKRKIVLNIRKGKL